MNFKSQWRVNLWRTMYKQIKLLYWLNDTNMDEFWTPKLGILGTNALTL